MSELSVVTGVNRQSKGPPPEARLVILDRDGVVNADSDAYIKSETEFQPYPESLAAIVRLKSAGKLVAIATNQSGISRGYFDEAALLAMHAKLFELLAATAGAEKPRGASGRANPTIVQKETSAKEGRPRAIVNPAPWLDYLLYCPHGPDDGCVCRKPRPGMLLEILDRARLGPADALFIGDSLSDLQAAQAAGVPARLVRTGKGQRTLAQRETSETARAVLGGVPVYANLAAAVADLTSIALDDD